MNFLIIHYAFTSIDYDGLDWIPSVSHLGFQIRGFDCTFRLLYSSGQITAHAFDFCKPTSSFMPQTTDTNLTLLSYIPGVNPKGPAKHPQPGVLFRSVYKFELIFTPNSELCHSNGTKSIGSFSHKGFEIRFLTQRY